MGNPIATGCRLCGHKAGHGHEPWCPLYDPVFNQQEHTMERPAHVPIQVGNTNPDGTPMSRHSTPGDICAGCSNLETGLLVPINQCVTGWRIFMNERDQQGQDRLRASGLMRHHEDRAHNCYCGGPEEIYPHPHGTGYHCRRSADV